MKGRKIFKTWNKAAVLQSVMSSEVLVLKLLWLMTMLRLLLHTPASDVDASPPPFIHYHREPEISFVFDDILEYWDPYPMIFLPRPQHSAPTEQGLCCSARSHASPMGADAAYLAAIQGSKTRKGKKNEKNKNKGPDAAASRKHILHEDTEDETNKRPAAKKSKMKDIVVVSDDEHEYFPQGVPYFS